MKIKNAKIITLILALAMIVGAVIGISASADNAATPSLDIVSKNLSYGGTISIAFAVDAKNVGDNEVSLHVYDSEPASETAEPAYTVASSLKQNVYGTECLVFFTKGIAVKDMPDLIYVRASVEVGGVTYYSELERYSVAEYAYDVQYRSDLGDDFVKIGEYLVGLGDKIQTVLPHDKDNKPSDFLYAAVEDGTLDGKYNSGLYKAGDKVTLKYTGAGSFFGWDVKYIAADGTVTTATVADNTVITLDKHTVATPASATLGFENGDLASSLLTYKVNNAVADASSDAAKSVFSVVADPANTKNKVLKVTNYNTAASSYINTTERSELNVKNPVTPAADDVYATFEGDFFIENTTNKSGSWAIAIILKSNTYAEMLQLSIDGEGKAIVIKEANDTKEGTAGTNNTIANASTKLLNNWFNLRVDYFVNGLESVVTVYIDGQRVYSAIAYNNFKNAETVKPITNVDIRFRQHFNFMADNLSVSTSATAPEAPEFKRDSFDSSAVPSYITVRANSTKVEIANDPVNSKNKVLSFVQASANSPRPTFNTSITAPYFTFASDVYIQRGTKTGTLNELFVTGNSGDVFRLKIQYVDNQIRLRKWTMKDGTNQKTEDFATPIVLEEGKWFNLRFDYCVNGTNSYLNIYIDGELVASEANYYYVESKIVNTSHVNALAWQITGYGTGTSNGFAYYFDNLAFTNNLGEFIK